MTVTWTGGPDDEVDADEITELSAASTRPATATTTAAATASAAARARAALVEAEYGG